MAERDSPSDIREFALACENEMREKAGKPPLTYREQAIWKAGWWAANRYLVEFVYGNDLPLWQDYSRKDQVRLARALVMLRAIPEWAVPAEEPAP